MKVFSMQKPKKKFEVGEEPQFKWLAFFWVVHSPYFEFHGQMEP